MDVKTSQFKDFCSTPVLFFGFRLTPAAFKWCQRPSITVVFHIDTLGIRRRTLANAFVRRLMSILDNGHATVRQKLQARKTQIALNPSDAFQRIVPLVTKPLRKDQIMSMKQTMREKISRNMRRPVPIWTRLPPALQLKSTKHRALACRWHLGVFPVHYRYLSSIGLHMYLDDLRSLSQKKVTNSGTEKDTNRANGIARHPRT